MGMDIGVYSEVERDVTAWMSAWQAEGIFKENRTQPLKTWQDKANPELS